MSRDVCGICWCPYDEEGACGCAPVRVIDPVKDEALLKQALEALEYMNMTAEHRVDQRIPDEAITALRERLGES